MDDDDLDLQTTNDERRAYERAEKREYRVTSYQDDVDTDPEKSDPLMNELNDDPVDLLGVPAEELRSELDKRDTDIVDGDNPDGSDDNREAIEDMDDDDDDERGQ